MFYQDVDMMDKLRWENTYDEGYYRVELITFLIIFIILTTLLCLLIYYNFKNKNLSEKWLLTRFCIVLLVGICVVLLFILEIIKVWLTVESTNSNFIWVLLIAILLGIYIVIIGATSSMKEANKFILLGIIVSFFLMGFGLFGFLIYFDLPFLVYKYYESNTIRGIMFLTLNLHLFLLIYVISYISESEVKG